MNFLSSITEYVSKAISTVKSTVDGSDKVVSQNNSSQIINGNPEPVGDTFSNTNAINKQQLSKNNLGALEQYIDTSCIANNIDKKELYRLLMSMLNLKNTQEFHALPEEKQMMFLGIVGASIERAAKYKAKFNNDIDITKMVIADIKLVQDAINNKVFENEEEICKMTNNEMINEAANSFLDNIDKLSPDELNEAIDKLEENFKNFKISETGKLSKLSPKERAIAEKRLADMITFERERLYNEVLMAADTEHAVNAIVIVDGKSLLNAQKRLYDTRKNGKFRMQAANMFNNERNERIAEFYYRKREPLSPEIYQGFIGENVSHMDAQYAKTLMIDYIKSRQKYESEGYPEYLNHEMMVATATGYAGGLQVNEFMSLEERMNALTNFYNQEEQYFADSEEIKEGANTFVDNYIEEHSSDRPDLKNEVDTIRKQVNESTKSSDSKSSERNNTNSENNTDKSEKTSNTSKKSETNYQLPSNSFYSESKEKQNNVSENRKTNSTSNPIKNNNSVKNEGAKSDKKYEMLLSSGIITIEEAIKECGNKNQIFEIIFSNNNLLAIYEQKAIEYIRNKTKVEDLVNIAKSSKAMQLILTNNRVQQKDKLYAKLEDIASAYQKYLFKDKEEENAVNKQYNI